jgi:hypothetical protein
MTREQYQARLAQLRKSPQYKEWEHDQVELIDRLKMDTEAIDPGEVGDDDGIQFD